MDAAIIAASTPVVTFAVADNADGTTTLLRNSVAVHKFFYLGGGGAVTDANPQGDRIMFVRVDGTVGIADATTFLNTLK